MVSRGRDGRTSKEMEDALREQIHHRDDAGGGDDEPALTGESTVLRPGYASEEPEEKVPEKPLTPLTHAHYEGCTEEQAADVYRDESLCFSCLSSPVCSVARPARETLAVVSRCLAYVPVNG